MVAYDEARAVGGDGARCADVLIAEFEVVRLVAALGKAVPKEDGAAARRGGGHARAIGPHAPWPAETRGAGDEVGGLPAHSRKGLPDKQAVVVGVGDHHAAVRGERDLAGPVHAAGTSAGEVGLEVGLAEHEVGSGVGFGASAPDEDPVVVAVGEQQAFGVARQRAG